MAEKRKSSYKLTKSAMVTATALLLAMYGCMVLIKPGIFTSLLSGSILFLLAITALARVNDIEPTKTSRRWHVRRFGLVMAGTGAVALTAAPWLEGAPYASWEDIVFQLGMLLTWMTTPHMPPWWEWISKKDGTGNDATKNN